MKRQDEVLVWMAESFTEDDFPFKTGQLYEKFQGDTGYDKTEAAFSELLQKLKDKGLVDNPRYGYYRPSKQGWTRAEKLESGGDSRPSGYEVLVEVLQNFLENHEEEEVKLSELHDFNNDAFDDFHENPDTFLDAVEDARKNSGTESIRFVNDLQGFDSGWNSIRNNEKQGEVISLDGDIIEVSERFTMKTEQIFECVQCGRSFTEKSLVNDIESPDECVCGSEKFDRAEEKLGDAKQFILEGNGGIRCVLHQNVIPETLLQDIRLGNHVKVTGILKFSGGRNSRAFLDVISVKPVDKVDKKNYTEEQRRKVKEKIDQISQNQNPFEIFAEGLVPEVKGRNDAKRIAAATLIGSPKGKISSLIVDSRKGGDAMVKRISQVFPDAVHASGSLKPETYYEDVKWTENGELLEASNGVLCVQDYARLEPEDKRVLRSAETTGSFKSGEEEFRVSNDLIASSPTLPEDDIFDLVCEVTGVGKDDVTQEFQSEDDYMLESELEIYRAVAKSVDPKLGDEAKTYLENAREMDGKEWETVLKLSLVYARARLSDEADLGDAEDALSLFESLRASKD